MRAHTHCRIVGDKRPLPPNEHYSTEEEDEAFFGDEPYVEPPFHCDYGTNVTLGDNVFINFNCTIIDTCRVTIGSRTLFGPNVSLYSGTHPLDPELRNGTRGPELGKEIHIEEDCWIGGNAIILGVRIGKGSTVGAGSVVTKVSLNTPCAPKWQKYPSLITALGCPTLFCRGRQSGPVDQAGAAKHHDR